jgi:hypothetical protein
MGDIITGFSCDGELGFTGNRALEFEGTRATGFILRVGCVKVPESSCAGLLGFGGDEVDVVLKL